MFITNIFQYIKTKIVISFALVVALLVTLILNRTVFISSTPRLNPQFIALVYYLPNMAQTIPNKLVAFFQHPTSSTARNTQLIQNQLAKAPTPKPNMIFTPLSKGVYAAEDPKTKQKIYKIEKGTQVEVRKITLKDGREFTIIIPP